MSEADMHNVAAYYAGLPPVAGAAGPASRSYFRTSAGKAKSGACAKCHGDDGNSTTAGVPSFAGQQPQYLVIAVQEYLHEERKAAPMHAMLRVLTRPTRKTSPFTMPRRLPPRVRHHPSATRLRASR